MKHYIENLIDEVGGSDEDPDEDEISYKEFKENFRANAILLEMRQ